MGSSRHLGAAGQDDDPEDRLLAQRPQGDRPQLSGISSSPSRITATLPAAHQLAASARRPCREERVGLLEPRG